MFPEERARDPGRISSNMQRARTFLSRAGATSHNLNRTLSVLRDGLGNAAQQEPFEPCPSQRAQNDQLRIPLLRGIENFRFGLASDDIGTHLQILAAECFRYFVH